MNRQQDLFTDLPRGEQLKLLRSVELEPWQRKSVKVSGKMQKAVLRVIDDHEGSRGCFASQATIAAEIGCSEVTVTRAIAALIDRDLITKERPNHWSPNHHRINWTALGIIGKESKDVSTRHHDRSRRHSDVSSNHHDASDTSCGPVGGVTMTGPSRHSDARNAPLTDQLNDHLTAPWLVVAGTMFRWGLKTSRQACQSAHDRGWSIEYVAELFREAGGDREPERWEPGQLANWLTGRTPPPFDEAEAQRRRDARDESSRKSADRIRESVRSDGERRGVPKWAVQGVTFRKLREAGFERFALEDERDAAVRLDEHDRSQRLGRFEPWHRPRWSVAGCFLPSASCQKSHTCQHA